MAVGSWRFRIAMTRRGNSVMTSDLCRRQMLWDRGRGRLCCDASGYRRKVPTSISMTLYIAMCITRRDNARPSSSYLTGCQGADNQGN